MRQDTSVGLPPSTTTSASQYWTYGGIEEHECWHAPVHIVIERERGGLDHSFLCQNEAERPTHRYVSHCSAHRTSPWTSTKHRPATSTAAVRVNTNLVSRMVTCECISTATGSVHYGMQGVQSACTMLLRTCKSRCSLPINQSQAVGLPSSSSSYSYSLPLHSRATANMRRMNTLNDRPERSGVSPRRSMPK